MSDKFSKDDLVSVIVPTYNTERFLYDCLLSISKQTYKNFELIIVDNESRDSTQYVINKFYRNFVDKLDIKLDSAKFLYIGSWQEPVERALEIAEGSYFTVVGSDDIIKPNYVLNCMKIMKKIEGAHLAFNSAMYQIDEEEKIYSGLMVQNYKDIKDLKRQLLLRCPIFTPSLFYDMEIYRSGVFKYDSATYAGNSDYFMYCEMVDQGHFIPYFPHPLGYVYRWNTEQSTWTLKLSGVDYEKMVMDYWKKEWNEG